MINSIEIKNFKSIKSKHFGLRNLNVLLGLNGMGKSSFIQSLLAVRQSEKITHGELALKGKYANIGTTKDALYQYAKKSPLSLQLKFSSGAELNYQFDYKLEAEVFRATNVSPDVYGEYEHINPNIKDEALFSTNFQYLNASRQEPTAIMLKNHSEVIELRNIGNHGEFSAHYIETFGNEDIELEKLIHPDSIVKDELTGEDMVVKTLINQTNKWMGEISPNISVRTTEISSDNVMLEYVYKQPNLGNTNRFKPENVGFGITYGLPVVIALLKAKPNDLLIIENPESHIHPRGQVELGKMMALTAASGAQLIVETHSDHIINGIRVATKQELLDNKDALIYYFDKIVKPDEQYSKITNIEIDKKGELSEYPKNMLDEWNDQLMKLL